MLVVDLLEGFKEQIQTSSNASEGHGTKVHALRASLHCYQSQTRAQGQTSTGQDPKDHRGKMSQSNPRKWTQQHTEWVIHYEQVGGCLSDARMVQSKV